MPPKSIRMSPGCRPAVSAADLDWTSETRTPSPGQSVIVDETAGNRRGLRRHAEYGAAYAAVADERRHDLARGVDGHGERDALAAANDGGIHARDQTVARDERPAGIPGLSAASV